MCDYSRIDRIRNEVIWDLVKVTPTEDKMRETRLQWFDHMKRMRVDVPVRRCETINILEGKRGRDDQRRVWMR